MGRLHFYFTKVWELTGDFKHAIDRKLTLKRYDLSVIIQHRYIFFYAYISIALYIYLILYYNFFSKFLNS